MKPKSDLCYIDPLYRLCNFLALTPPHVWGNSISSSSVRFKMYTACNIAVYVTLYAHSSYGREKYVYPGLDVTVALTDKIANFTLTAFNVTLRLLLIFYNGASIKLFFDQAHRLSTQQIFEGCSRRTFRVQFAVFHLYMVALILYDAYVWVNSVGWKMFQYYVGRSLTYYVCNLYVFLVFHSVVPIRHFFASLSAHLETVIKNLICDDDERKEYVLSEFKSVARVQENHDLRATRKYYNSICDMVDTFNGIYGFAILMIIIVVISYVLNLTDLLLVYGISKEKKIDGTQYGIDLIALCALWMITLLMVTILLAYGCAGAVSKSDKIAKICFLWINEMPALPTSLKDQLLKEELLLLAQQATFRCPKFSAAGFFPVDFTLLGFIFGTVTSYIIISIQFIDH